MSVYFIFTVDSVNLVINNNLLLYIMKILCILGLKRHYILIAKLRRSLMNSLKRLSILFLDKLSVHP